jgi:hypothetical protein
VEAIPSGYRLIDADRIVLAHVYGQPDGAITVSNSRLTRDEARRISKLISRLSELVELERDRNKAKSRSVLEAAAWRQCLHAYWVHLTPPPALIVGRYRYLDGPCSARRFLPDNRLVDERHTPALCHLG